MSRPTEPQKKEDLLERCLAAVIEEGRLDSSINAIAKRIGTSGRMLVYHFGSKHELERQILSLLETRLREKLWSFQGVSFEGVDCLAESLLEIWRHITSPEMRGLLRLTMDLNQRAMQGDLETRRFLEQECQKWVNSDSLLNLTHDKTTALLLFHLFQGAILDFLTTGNAQRGQQTIKAFTETLQ
ncbi:TetR/AcrR family transcriptional regulator [Candidatus Gracilibacteria bacterium]|jgi:AcrR family transcriptional regulator|nr:TetR/AcrR family transcriptional regulator [Candidatus Gracilibacteria bacterium]NJM89116.1 TetR/AcrR family transcriptional regulator [Hydrococcus sp. RU_2_2]NJP20712.1 TetR/AcrR family transcriptional regulator [Hydrococcus sp. CRU_1_1]